MKNGYSANEKTSRTTDDDDIMITIPLLPRGKNGRAIVLTSRKYIHENGVGRKIGFGKKVQKIGEISLFLVVVLENRE